MDARDIEIMQLRETVNRLEARLNVIDDSPFWTTAQAADYLKMNIDGFYRWCKEAGYRGIKNGMHDITLFKAAIERFRRCYAIGHKQESKQKNRRKKNAKRK